MTLKVTIAKDPVHSFAQLQEWRKIVHYGVHEWILTCLRMPSVGKRLKLTKVYDLSQPGRHARCDLGREDVCLKRELLCGKCLM